MSITLSAIPSPIYLSATEPTSYVKPQGGAEASATSLLDASRLDTGDEAAQPLDKLLLDAMQQASASTQHRFADVQALIALPTPELLGDGEDEMINLQSMLGDFSIAVSLQSALARKSVNAIEMLIKS